MFCVDIYISSICTSAIFVHHQRASSSCFSRVFLFNQILYHHHFNAFFPSQVLASSNNRARALARAPLDKIAQFYRLRDPPPLHRSDRNSGPIDLPQIDAGNGAQHARVWSKSTPNTKLYYRRPSREINRVFFYFSFQCVCV